jgi:hypothetical protein
MAGNSTPRQKDEVIRRIIKMQALLRGHLARKKFKKMHAMIGTTRPSDSTLYSVAHYYNELVQKTKADLGPFNYNPPPQYKDKIKRQFKDI